MIATYEHHSPSRLNLFCAEPALFTLQYVKGVEQDVGPPAIRGRAVEDGVTFGLTHLDAPPKGCAEIALASYDADTTMSGDPRTKRYRDDIPGMVETALAELRSYGTPSGMQGRIEWEPDTIEKPIIGFYDYRWDHLGILADLKTSERMPGSIKVPHARQVSLYAVSDNVDARLIYVTPKKLEAYRLENIRLHRQALLKIAQTVERFLNLSDDPDVLMSLVCPDVESFYWNTPRMRQLAYEHWGI